MTRPTEVHLNASKLMNQLKSRGEYEDVLKKLAEIDCYNKKALFLEGILKDHNLIPEIAKFQQKKSQETSDYNRDQGNKIYGKRNFLFALGLYNKSLCFAPVDSENVSSAYANRSAAYFEMGDYEKALENIELAKSHNCPKRKLSKLKIREEKCLENLQKCPSVKNKYQQHEIIRNEVLSVKLPENEKLPCYIADCLELNNTPDFGRGIVTKCDLKVGTVVAIEESLTKRLVHNDNFTRCVNCFKSNMFNVIPCDSCCSAMFCSKDCKDIAWEKFHHYECEVADAINELFVEKNTIGLRTFFEALSIFNNDLSALKEFTESIKLSKATVLGFDFSKMNKLEKKKSLLHSIDALHAGDSPISNDGDFVQTCTSVVLINLILNHSKFGLSLNEEQREIFREFTLKHSLIGIVNAHYLYGAYEENNEIKFDNIGSGLFPFASLLNHSCAPNVSRIDFQLKIHFIVKRPIKAGEQLFDSYGPQYYKQTVVERKQKFKIHYGFNCQCEACQQPDKFPLLFYLKEKDPINFKRILDPDIENIENWDLKRILRKYQELCRYIEKTGRQNYPCKEIAAAQNYAFVLGMNAFSLTDGY